MEIATEEKTMRIQAYVNVMPEDRQKKSTTNRSRRNCLFRRVCVRLQLVRKLLVLTKRDDANISSLISHTLTRRTHIAGRSVRDDRIVMKAIDETDGENN